jgi:hypothetical protein
MTRKREKFIRKVVPDMKNESLLQVTGHVRIFDPESNHVFVDKKNAIHFENISEALAYSLANKRTNFITEMHFGRGGTNFDSTGVINFLPTNTNTQNADLYNPTFFKIIDDSDEDNTDPVRNAMSIRHVPGTVYSDILCTCLLDYGEPQGQTAFDNLNTLENNFVFDELGIKAWSPSGPGTGKLLTHVVFHPIQKSLNRLVQIDYTIRIQSLTNLTGIT